MRPARLLASAALGIALVTGCATPAFADVVETSNESNGISKTFTSNAISDDSMEKADGASVVYGSMPGAPNSATGQPYPMTAVEGFDTFAIINLSNYNKYLKDYLARGGGSSVADIEYYVRYSINKNVEGEVLIELVNKGTDGVIDQKRLTRGSTVAFDALKGNAAAAKQSGSTRTFATQASYPMFSYTTSASSAGTWADSIVVDWNDGRANYYNSVLVYSSSGGASDNDTANDRSDWPIRVPKSVGETTYYKSVDGQAITSTEAAQSYTPTGNELPLAEYTLNGIVGSKFTSSTERSIGNYVLYYGHPEQGFLVQEYAAGTRYRSDGNPNLQYNVKSITTVLDGEGQITRDDLYVPDPSQPDFLSYVDAAGETPIRGYLKVDPAGNPELRTTLMSMTTDELVGNADYFVAASEASAEQKLNPAIYSGYKYVLSSDHLNPCVDREGNEQTGDIQNAKLTSVSSPDNAGFEGSFTLTDSTGKSVQFGVWTGNRQITNNAGKSSTGSNARLWLMALDEGAGLTGGVADGKNPTANAKIDPETGNFLEGNAWFAPYSGGNFTDTNDVVTIGGTGSTTLYNNLRFNGKDAYYYYIEKGAASVSFVNESGETIADDVVLVEHGDAGEGYNMTEGRDQRETDGVIVVGDHRYYYKEILPVEGDSKVVTTDEVVWGESITRQKDTVAEEGEIENGTLTHLTYVYALKGDVVVNYKDLNTGAVLSDPVSDTDLTWEGVEYDTSDNAKQTIVKDGVTYRLVPGETTNSATHVKGSDAQTGEVAEGTTTVTYYYQPVHGSVHVDYKTIDTDKKLLETYTDTLDADLGQGYDTTETKSDGSLEKPELITTALGTKYRLVDGATKTEVNGVQVAAAPSGEVVEGDTVVTYYYELVTGNVVVHYVNEDGETIKADVNDEVDAPEGIAYNTAVDNKPKAITAADGKTYVLVEGKTSTKVNGEKTPVAETGTVVEGVTEVTYVYKEVTGAVTVHYVDEDGNPIKEDEVDTTDAPVGSAYDVTDHRHSTITTDDGVKYELVPVKTTTEVNGEPTEPSENGEVVEGITEVTYVYKQVSGNVVIHYVSDDGLILKDDVADSVNVDEGTAYDTTEEGEKPETIVKDGKTYKLIPSAVFTEVNGKKLADPAEQGEVVAGLTEVTYVYKLVTGDVVVHYTDEDGNPIKDDVIDSEKGNIGDPYDTTDNKPQRITTDDGKTYELVPERTEGDEDGAIVEGVTEVTYVYKEVTGSVVVDYKIINTDVSLKDRYTDTPEGTSTGVSYDAMEDGEMPATITKDGKTYRLVTAATDGDPRGLVTEGEILITYYYELVEEPVVPADEEPASDSSNPSNGTEKGVAGAISGLVKTGDGLVYVVAGSIAAAAAAAGAIVLSRIRAARERVIRAGRHSRR